MGYSSTAVSSRAPSPSATPSVSPSLSPSVHRCRDGVLDDLETDVDCGGEHGCPRCGLGLRCAVHTDCESGYCDETCAALCDGLDLDVVDEAAIGDALEGGALLAADGRRRLVEPRAKVLLARGVVVVVERRAAVAREEHGRQRAQHGQ